MMDRVRGPFTRTFRCTALQGSNPTGVERIQRLTIAIFVHYFKQYGRWPKSLRNGPYTEPLASSRHQPVVHKHGSIDKVGACGR